MAGSEYKNRRQAGRHLARSLIEYTNRADVIVLGIPRGGVPVAYEVARKLKAPLDIFSVRKLGMPGHEELAMGAIAPNGAVVFNQEVIAHVPAEAVGKVLEKERLELGLRETKYRAERPFPELKGKSVILVDDGLATGASMKVAVQAIRQYEPSKIVAAVPVAPHDTCQELRVMAVQVICPCVPPHFQGVGMHYQDFSQTCDEEVISLLENHRKHFGGSADTEVKLGMTTIIGAVG